MKSNEELDKERFYEITEVKEGDCWYKKPGGEYCICGVIVQPTEQRGKFRIIKACPSGYFSSSINEELYFGASGEMTLRPLNKRDQTKLERIRSQFV